MWKSPAAGFANPSDETLGRSPEHALPCCARLPAYVTPLRQLVRSMTALASTRTLVRMLEPEVPSEMWSAELFRIRTLLNGSNEGLVSPLSLNPKMPPSMKLFSITTFDALLINIPKC
jgi:hypothetical protein